MTPQSVIYVAYARCDSARGMDWLLRILRRILQQVR